MQKKEIVRMSAQPLSYKWEHNSMFECCSAKCESYQTDCFATSYKSLLQIWLFWRDFAKSQTCTAAILELPWHEILHEFLMRIWNLIPTVLCKVLMSAFTNCWHEQCSIKVSWHIRTGTRLKFSLSSTTMSKVVKRQKVFSFSLEMMIPKIVEI